MSLENPAWLLLLPALALLAWWWRAAALWRPLRAVILVALTILLAGPRAHLQKDGMDLWLLLDRSESTGDRIDRGLPEWTRLITDAARTRDDEVHVVEYAMDVVARERNGGGAFTAGRALTRTSLALDNVMALQDPRKPSRILLLTDGYSTESLAGAAERLTKENIPLDLRLLPGPPGPDYRVSQLRLPSQAQAGEPFVLEATISGPADGEVPLTILRNGTPVLETKAILSDGRGTARFTDRISLTGSWRYEARITPSDDAHPGNNRHEAWVAITGGPRLLLVTGYQDDPVAAVLRRQFDVEVVENPGSLRAGQLAGCRAVFFNNVPAWEVPAEFLASLDFFVHGQGGGLLMAGGERSFGAGGYFRSPVDELLPVSMELKKDQRKLTSAIAIVLDRSGSMSAGVGGSRTKMDLANEGAAKAIEFMGYQDSVAVFAVDSEAHEMVPMQQIADEGNKGDLLDLARRITSGGGGIFVYNGLKAGWKALRDAGAAAGTRHIILFADAADAEQPGDGPGADYKSLLEEVVRENGTCSVIALGTATDSDAEFLRDVAARGRGRIFFTDRAEDLPNVFTAETLAVTRNTFVREPVSNLASGQWQEISAAPLAWPEQVDGYNLSYKRDWASQALLTKDEYTAPLVAWGRRGAGRSVAVSFALGGNFSESVRAWPAYGDFLQTTARWLMGEALPPDIALRHETVGTTLNIDLLYAGEWEATFAGTPPRILLAGGERAAERREATWERMQPGHYRASIDLTEGEVVRGAIQAGQHTLPFGPFTAGTNAEWAFDPARIEELRQVSAQSGGRELVDLQDVWTSPPAREATDLRRWLLPVVLGLVLAEALVTRTGWRWPRMVWPWRRRVRPRPLPIPPVAAPVSVPSPVAPPVVPAAAAVVEDAGAVRRKVRFARAKKR